MTMKILQYPRDQKSLRVAGKPVTREMVQSSEFQAKLAEMKDVLERDGDGIGLAAVQVGWSVNLFLLNRNQQMEPIPTTVFLNAKIVNSSKSLSSDDEGCLSFPNLVLTIKRPYKITWEYETLEGSQHQVESYDYYARAVQHEIDHNAGVFFTDLASSAQRLKFERWLKQRPV